jgi:hypothetical protein
MNYTKYKRVPKANYVSKRLRHTPDNSPTRIQNANIGNDTSLYFEDLSINPNNMVKSKSVPKDHVNKVYLNIYFETEYGDNEIEKFNKAPDNNEYAWHCLDFHENIDDEQIDLIEKFLAFQI